MAPEEWRGALAITYHVGPGPAKVHLKVTFELGHQADLRRDRHLARLRRRPVGASRQSPRRLGQRRRRSHLRPGGNARRSPQCSASCTSRAGLRSAPSSIAPGMARSRACWAPSNGWKPTWRSCKQHAVAYINSDSNGRGYLFPAEPRICRVSSAAWPGTSRIPKPTVRVPALAPGQHRQSQGRGGAPRPAQSDDLVVTALGDGSDFTAFQDLAGISTLKRRVRRRGRRHAVSFDLRRLLLVHALRRHRFRLWSRLGADRRAPR